MTSALPVCSRGPPCGSDKLPADLLFFPFSDYNCYHCPCPRFSRPEEPLWLRTGRDKRNYRHWDSDGAESKFPLRSICFSRQVVFCPTPDVQLGLADIFCGPRGR